VVFSGTVSSDGANVMAVGDDRISQVDPGDPPGTVDSARIASLNLVASLRAILVVEGIHDADALIETPTDLNQWREMGALNLNSEGSGSFVHSKADPIAIYQ